MSLSWASLIQSIYPHPTSWRSILILSTHLRLGLPSGVFPSGFPTKTLHTLSPHPYAPHAQPISFFSILSPAQYWVSSTNHVAPRYAISSIPPLSRPSCSLKHLKPVNNPVHALPPSLHYICGDTNLCSTVRSIPFGILQQYPSGVAADGISWYTSDSPVCGNTSSESNILLFQAEIADSRRRRRLLFDLRILFHLPIIAKRRLISSSTLLRPTW